MRWDTSPNRQLIHHIIDAYEDGHYIGTTTTTTTTLDHHKGRTKKERKKRKGNFGNEKKKLVNTIDVKNENNSVDKIKNEELGEEDIVNGDEMKEAAVLEKGYSVQKIVNFIGQRIWGIWGV